MRCLGGRNGVDQISGWIGLAVPLFDAIAEYPAYLAADAMGGKSRSAPIYALQYNQYLRGVDFSDRALAEPWEYIVLHAGECLLMLRWLYSRPALSHPAASDNLKRMSGREQAGSFFRLLCFTRIDAGSELFTGFVALLPCDRQCNVWVDAERVALFLAPKPVFEAPPLAPARGDFQIEATPVEQAHGLVGRLGVPDGCIG